MPWQHSEKEKRKTRGGSWPQRVKLRWRHCFWRRDGITSNWRHAFSTNQTADTVDILWRQQTMGYKSKRTRRKLRSESSSSSTSDVPAQSSSSQQKRSRRPGYLQLFQDSLSWLTRSKRSPHPSSSYKSTVSNAGLSVPHKVVSKLSTIRDRLNSRCTQTRCRSRIKRTASRRGRGRRRNRATRGRRSRRAVTRKGRSRYRRKVTCHRGGKSRKRRMLRSTRHLSTRRTGRRVTRSKANRARRCKLIKTNRSKIVKANRRNAIKRKLDWPLRKPTDTKWSLLSLLVFTFSPPPPFPTSI